MTADATPEELAAIEVARGMARAGIPIFVCRPNPYRPGKYFVRAGWPAQRADPSVLDDWRPGWGVAAVGGTVADFLDMDPRSGGIESQIELKNAGEWPLSFGQQATPSGGTHDVIAALGLGKETGFMPGLDYQGGLPAPDGEGQTRRAFIWLAPTVGVSKETGEQVPYRWIHEPDVDALLTWRERGDGSGAGISSRILAAQQLRRSSGAGKQLVSGAMGAGDRLFGNDREERAFTIDQAKEFVLPSLMRLRDAPIGRIEEEGMNATLAIEHFVPEFWTVDQAYAIICDNLSYTAYDPNGPSDWHADKFLARLDGRRPVLDSWKAKLATVSLIQPAPEPAPRNTGRLRAAMLRRSELSRLPEPVPLIEGVLYRNSVAVLSGKFGTYKTFVAVSWAASLATGVSWFGHRVPERVPVIYAAAEGAYGIRRRFDAWEHHHGVIIPDDLYLIPLAVRLNRPDDMIELADIVAESGAQALVFDTLHTSTPGVDENDSGQMGAVLDVLRGLQERFGVCSILPHHTGHAGERARGSSALEDDADTSFLIRLGQGEERGPDNPRIMTHRKAKDTELIPDIPLKFVKVPEVGSAYVTASDVFELAAGAGAHRPGEEVRIREPEEWTQEHTTPRAEMQRRILQALRDLAGEIGLTEPQLRTSIAERWYSGKTGRGGLTAQMWHKSWTAVRAKEVPGMPGEPLITSMGGARFALNAMARECEPAADALFGQGKGKPD